MHQDAQTVITPPVESADRNLSATVASIANMEGKYARFFHLLSVADKRWYFRQFPSPFLVFRAG
jgi:hypothetical protein